MVPMLHGSRRSPLWREHPWKPTYQVCQKLPNGLRQVIACYFTSEKAEAVANALNEQQRSEYQVFDSLTEKFIMPESEGKSDATPPGASSSEFRLRNAAETLKPPSKD